jgi:hypothetical protein
VSSRRKLMRFAASAWICVAAVSAPQPVSAKCAGAATFLDWFAWHPETKTVFVGTVVREAQWTNRDGADYNAIELDVVRVLVGSRASEGSKVTVYGGTCVNAAPHWRQGELHIVGAEAFERWDGLEFPVCAEPGLLLSNGIAYDLHAERVGSIDELALQLDQQVQVGIVERRLERLWSWGLYAAPLLLSMLAGWLRARDRRKEHESRRWIGRLSPAFTGEHGSISSPAGRRHRPEEPGASEMLRATR